MGKRAKNAGKKKSKIQEPKLATELCSEVKEIFNDIQNERTHGGRGGMCKVANRRMTAEIQEKLKLHILINTPN